MVINPSIEVYLLDASGRILTFSAPPGKVVRKRVALAPLRAFLSENPSFPLRGDDPRREDRQKVFSVAPILGADGIEGYLYVVLGGTAYESVADMLQGSYVLRLGIGVALAGLAITLLLGIVCFNWLTRRLRRLTRAVERFQGSDFELPPELGQGGGEAGDEIDQLTGAFQRMSAQIAEQIAALERADASRRELVANISHDLRTPMATLQGYLETLQMKHGSLAEEQRRHFLDLALEHGERLGRLIGELFELARLEDRDSELDVEPFSLGELLQDVTQKFQLAATERGLALETAIPETAPFVSGDIGLIERVLENLIENAIKYTAAGGSVRLTLIPGTDRVQAQVSDTGRGISEADIAHIFERAYRGQSAGARDSESAGLGLAIVKRILQLHGGSIEVESALNRGTSFTFDLPAITASG
jgi:signal transduction histidine kinase